MGISNLKLKEQKLKKEKEKFNGQDV